MGRIKEYMTVFEKEFLEEFYRVDPKADIILGRLFAPLFLQPFMYPYKIWAKSASMFLDLLRGHNAQKAEESRKKIDTENMKRKDLSKIDESHKFNMVDSKGNKTAIKNALLKTDADGKNVLFEMSDKKKKQNDKNTFVARSTQVDKGYKKGDHSGLKYEESKFNAGGKSIKTKVVSNGDDLVNSLRTAIAQQPRSKSDEVYRLVINQHGSQSDDGADLKLTKEHIKEIASIVKEAGYGKLIISDQSCNGSVGRLLSEDRELVNECGIPISARFAGKKEKLLVGMKGGEDSSEDDRYHLHAVDAQGRVTSRLKVDFTPTMSGVTKMKPWIAGQQTGQQTEKRRPLTSQPRRGGPQMQNAMYRKPPTLNETSKLQRGGVVGSYI